MINETQAQQVAQTIANQLGGFGRLKMMIGVRTFRALINDCGGLAFHFPNRMRSKPNLVRVVLEASDTYRVEFWRLGKRDYKELETVSDVYADQLKGLIENRTGLYLSF